MKALKFIHEAAKNIAILVISGATCYVILIRCPDWMAWIFLISVGIWFVSYGVRSAIIENKWLTRKYKKIVSGMVEVYIGLKDLRKNINDKS